MTIANTTRRSVTASAFEETTSSLATCWDDTALARRQRASVATSRSARACVSAAAPWMYVDARVRSIGNPSA